MLQEINSKLFTQLTKFIMTWLLFPCWPQTCATLLLTVTFQCRARTPSSGSSLQGAAPALPSACNALSLISTWCFCLSALSLNIFSMEWSSLITQSKETLHLHKEKPYHVYHSFISFVCFCVFGGLVFQFLWSFGEAVYVCVCGVGLFSLYTGYNWSSMPDTAIEKINLAFVKM